MKGSPYIHGTQMKKTVTNMDQDAEVMDAMMGNPFVQIRKIPQVSFIHDVYIANEIVLPAAYSPLMSALHTAPSDDQVHIHLNTYGGDGGTAIQLVHAIQRSQAHVVAFAEGDVASAGTFIFLAADSQVVQPYASLMIHNFSGGVFGKGHEIKSQSDHIHKRWRKFFDDVYEDFLTKKEIKEVIEGRDMWMMSDEVEVRLKKREQKRQARIEKEMKADPQLAKLLEEMQQ